jgi:flagellar operon protein
VIDKLMPGQPVQQVRGVNPQMPGTVQHQMPAQPDVDFRQLLDESLRTSGGVKFSAHAMRRLESRGITLADSDVKAIEQAIGRAEAKGSRDSLVLAPEYAMVVNVPSRTVITMFDQQQLDENVVTNIDSAVFVAE